MSQPKLTLVVLVTTALVVVPLLGLGQEGGGQETAAMVGDQALTDLASWKHAATKTYLDSKQAAHGASAPFKTAWGLMLAEQGKLDEALTQLAAASAANTSDPASEFYRGEVLAWKRNADEARAAWNKANDRAKTAVEARPEDARARYYRGAALIRLRSFGEARTHLNTAREKGFDPGMVNLQIGLSFVYEQKWNEAISALDAAIAADSGLAHAYYYRGRAWKELGRNDKMINDMDRFLRLAPDAPESEVARGMLGG